MVFRDGIKEIITKKVPDGKGGSTEEVVSERSLLCKASINTNPAVMNAFGLTTETVLYLVTREELNPNAIYLYKKKKYNVRTNTNNGRLFYSTLIEIK